MIVVWLAPSQPFPKFVRSSTWASDKIIFMTPINQSIDRSFLSDTIRTNTVPRQRKSGSRLLFTPPWITSSSPYAEQGKRKRDHAKDCTLPLQKRQLFDLTETVHFQSCKLFFLVALLRADTIYNIYRALIPNLSKALYKIKWRKRYSYKIL